MPRTMRTARNLNPIRGMLLATWVARVSARPRASRVKRIRKHQKTAERLIRKRRFQRLGRVIAQHLKTYLCSRLSKRVIIMHKYIHLVRRERA